MHLYFNLDECGSVTADAEGREVPDLATAHALALKAAREVMCAELAEGRLCLACHIEVTDDRGDPVLHLRFRDAVTVSGL